MFPKYLKEKSRSEFAWWQQMAQEVFMWNCLLAITQEFLKTFDTTHHPVQWASNKTPQIDSAPKTWKYLLALERKGWNKTPLSLLPECPYPLSDLPHSKMKTSIAPIWAT